MFVLSKSEVHKLFQSLIQMQTNDDRLTFLLPRPVWVNDMDVAYCSSCNASFGPLKRRHHCRSCGNIFCHDCSSKSVPLPQLGYGTKAVRVCNGCFDVAYLVTYAIDEDHGLSTQMHGVRGLLELTEKDNEKELHNMVAYGGVDALIWLCRASTSTHLHHLVTTVLALLAEKESIRPVIITKWAVPPLLFLIQQYTAILTSNSNDNSNSRENNNCTSPSRANVSEKRLKARSEITSETYTHQHPVHSSASSSTTSFTDTHIKHSILLETIINCTHVLYQLSRAGILSQKEVFKEGILAILFELSAFGSKLQPLQLQAAEGANNDSEDSNNDQQEQQQQQQRQQIQDRINIIQGLAAKSISCISSIIAFQTHIIEYIVQPENRSNDKLANLLRASHEEVQKYMAKTVAYLSLKNDKYKPMLLAEERAKALVFIIAMLPMKLDDVESKEWKKKDLSYYSGHSYNGEVKSVAEKLDHQQKASPQPSTRQHLNSAPVSHVCCALANFATNNESQEILMSQPHVLAYLCNVFHVFPNQPEIHKHVARCLANLALYEANNEAMLWTNKAKQIENKKKISGKDGYNVLPTLLMMGKSTSKSEVQRHIVRAVDNLNSNLPLSENDTVPLHLNALFSDAYDFIDTILTNTYKEEEEPKDADMIKRAKSIMARRKSLMEQSDTPSASHTSPIMDDDQEPTSSPSTTKDCKSSEILEEKKDVSEVDDEIVNSADNSCNTNSKEENEQHSEETGAAAELTITTSSSSLSSASKDSKYFSEDEAKDNDNNKKEVGSQHQERPTEKKAVTPQKASNNKKRKSKKHK
ncbi:hypothetical protein BDF20DRAFT_914129 [Mycotypha africana]|uniref:uncharacterized protein n=1 Tax=Mycotypha africana TaxID=64632 RepID=UPI00230155F4|nr:uncharacterized protein BDF20DRAFT_914129 [Mycotypha africana]KAI8975163.1 hypothetical protein BDF20DRAFT_914129 [Mycotypha africana]